ncbi:MAG: hypothetical protein H3C48_06320 [Chitinophagaceae bacterium]|nr:hypothetical protein [Chitinophagaceae bacterium]
MYKRIIGFVYIALLYQGAFAQDMGSITKQKPFKINGSLSVGAGFYSASGIPNRREPFRWSLMGSPVVSIYGITFPFSFVVSDQERNFSQPFNQYGVSPYYKWITLHAGYRNVHFSDYTLAGANFLGGGIELNPGKFRFGFISGRFNRAVNEDSISGLGYLGYIRPVYKRTGYAAKIGIGNNNNYLDFIAFKAKDDIHSIAPVSSKSMVTPEENAALGVKSHLSFLQNKLIFDLDAGGSLYTKDSRLEKFTDSAAFPIMPWAGGLVKLNSSSEFSKAVTTSLGYNFRTGSLTGKYQRVDPGYRSLGAYYFQEDVEQFTISPSFSMLKGKLYLNLSGGLSHDNLNNKKYATTKRSIYAANVNIAAGKKFNIGLDYSNFGVNQRKGIGDFFDDSTAMSAINASYGTVISYRTASSDNSITHQVAVSANYQNTNDLNRFTEEYTNAHTFIGSLSYNLSLVPVKANASAGITYNNTEVYTGTITNISPFLRLSKMFLENKLRLSLSENVQLRQSDGLGDDYTSNTGLAVSYTISKHTIGITGGYLTNKYKIGTSGGAAAKNFSEIRSNISYSFHF